MLTAYIVGAREIEFKEVPVPEPGPGEIVIKVEVALTCGTDLKVFKTGKHAKLKIPGPFGHEYTGTVYKKAKEVKKFEINDPVFGVNTAPCFKCRYCKMGLYNHCLHLFDKMVIGAYSEYLKIPERIVKTNLFRRPPELVKEVAPFIEPLSAVIHGIKKLNIREKASVLIWGTGTLGLTFARLFKKKGVQDIWLVGRNKWKNERAREWKLGHVVDVEKVESALKDKRFNIVVEATGNPEVLKNIAKRAEKGGEVLYFAGTPQDILLNFSSWELHYNEIAYKGSFHFTPEDVKEAFKTLIEEQEFFKNFVTHRFPLRELKKAFEVLESGHAFKIAIIP